MGLFGRGQEIQFFMTDEDHKELLNRIKKEDVCFVKDTPYTSKDPPTVSDMPDDEWPTTNQSRIWYIYNRRYGKLRFIPWEKLKAYQIYMPYSPVIQFERSVLHKGILRSGRVSAMLSAYEYDAGGRKYDVKQPEGFVEWWFDVKKVVKRMCTKCIMLDPILKTTRAAPFWAGPDAVSRYKQGMMFQQIISDKGPQMTFHPEKWFQTCNISHEIYLQNGKTLKRAN